MLLCIFFTGHTSKDFLSHLTAVTKTMNMYQRTEVQRFVSKMPLDIVILVNKTNHSNGTCVSTIALLQQDLKKWFEQACDPQMRIDFVIRFRKGTPVSLCADNQL